MVSVMEVMDSTGHLTLTWNPDVPADVERARAEYDRLRQAGYAFFASDESDAPRVTTLRDAAFDQPGSLDVRMVHTKEFRPGARRQVAVRPMRGG